ncbi:MAG: glycosyltransferase, partial [Actinobacteria bacterium]|nr:glycosyltransferase [Actinomycetota bacterium]
LEAATLRESREVHAGSRSNLDLAYEQFSGLTAREHVLPHGLADRATPDVEPIGRGELRRVLFVGRLERRKGVDVLLSAAPDLLARHPDVELVLVGRDTPHTELGETYREWFRREHAGDGAVLDRVRFLGEVDDNERDRWYASADVFCAPSRYESFGLVLLEAMAHGVPVVSCDAGGVADIVDGNGLLAKPGDTASLLACLDTLLSDPQMCADMGRRSRELFEKTWSLAPWVERVTTAYASLAADHRPDGTGIDPGRLASILTEVGAVPPQHAAEAAAELLNPLAYPVDEPSRLVDLLLSDDEAFVRGLYEMLLGREAEEAGLKDALGRLARGLPRLDLVEAMGSSNEAHARGVDLKWLTAAIPLWSSALFDAVSDLVRQPDQEFCEGLYTFVLQRAPDPDGLRAMASHLANGGDRMDAVRSVAGSDEALRRRVPVDWVARVGPSARAPGPPADPLSGRDLLRRAKSAVRRLSQPALDLRRSAFGTGASAAPPSSARTPLPTGDGRGLVKNERLQHSIFDQLSSLTAATSQANEAVTSIVDAVARAQRESLAAFAAAVDDLLAKIAASTEALSKVQRDDTVNITQWLDVLGRKQQAMALELRERLPAIADTADLPEPVVVDPERLQALLDSGRPVRLNLGCGEKPLPGHVNIDARPLPDVDVVADARRLPFSPGSVDEVVSHHLVEHFRAHHLRSVVLPYWWELLRPGGRVKIVCPNWSAMIELEAKGEISIADLAQVTFGMQDYQGDDHFAMYSPETLSDLLREAGFNSVDTVARE